MVRAAIRKPAPRGGVVQVLPSCAALRGAGFLADDREGMIEVGKPLKFVGLSAKKHPAVDALAKAGNGRACRR
jgi:hypothetical protein